ncbi:hypothetical protein B0O41_0554 [Propionibacteriaceae bacterium ES.041]|uniref:hypothetical protein n=1 Tax=Enemella evansiae TaxID=2016499 RepID=UPI000B9757F4|nr:hypothetical protein [Enemella evansiae]OYO10814.1 hypothetical protein CGZ98_09165 [Enemella evansiae]OYO15849.1 hypothetical protein BI335_11720 [Enemella evansiae]PFG65781.1 hypothetical protein B0O41_0554 [Propionibacteriaceae bacterium ES.041]
MPTPDPALPPVTGGRVDAGTMTRPANAQQRARLTLVPDYLDVFTLTTGTAATPRDWMTACFEQGIERSDRDLIFNRLLRLRTAPDGRPGHVAGWQVAQEEPGHLTVAAAGPLVAGNLVLDVLPDRIRLSTAIGYRTLGGRIRWELLSHIHRRQAPGVLRTGEQLLRQRLP